MELLEDGEGGLLVGRLDLSNNSNSLTIEELRDAMVKLIDQPELAATLGAECRRISEQFIWGRVVRNFEKSWWMAVRRTS
jgi:glycosyltransferase involved in cell wall biosynthesis